MKAVFFWAALATVVACAATAPEQAGGPTPSAPRTEPGSCGKPNAPAKQLDVIPMAATVQLPGSDTFIAVAYSACGQVTSAGQVSWSASDSTTTLAVLDSRRVQATPTRAGVLYLRASLNSGSDSGKLTAADTSCSGQSPSATISRVEVTPEFVQDIVGRVFALTAVAKTSCNVVVTTDSVVWTRSNAKITIAATDKRHATLTLADTGVAYAFGTIAGKKDSTRAQIDTTPTPVTLDTLNGCPQSGYLRLVAATPSTLGSKLSAAIPGDQIRMAAGSYSNFSITSKLGTAADSITLCGPKTAVVSGGIAITSLSYWQFLGFKVTGGVWNIYAQKIQHSTFGDLELTNSGQEGIQLWNTSSDNVIRNNWIHDTGKSSPQYGECVYIGSGGGAMANADPANRNLVYRNRFGPNCTAEMVDIKHGTTGNVVRGNKGDGAGFQFISGMSNSYMISGGATTRFVSDTLTNLSSTSAIALQFYNASAGVADSNRFSGSSYKWGFSTSAPAMATIYCSPRNTATGAIGFIIGQSCTP